MGDFRCGKDRGGQLTAHNPGARRKQGDRSDRRDGGHHGAPAPMAHESAGRREVLHLLDVRGRDFSRAGKPDRHRGRGFAIANFVDQGFGRRLRADPELGLEQCDQPVRLNERGIAAFVPGLDVECDALPILAQRIDGDEPLGESNRPRRR